MAAPSTPTRRSVRPAPSSPATRTPTRPSPKTTPRAPAPSPIGSRNSSPSSRLSSSQVRIRPKQHLGNVDFPTANDKLALAFQTCLSFTLTQDYPREAFDKEVADYREMGWKFEERWERREFVKEFHAELDKGNVVIVDKAARDLKAAVWIYFDDCMLQSEKLEKWGQYLGFRVESTHAAVASLATTAQNGSNGATTLAGASSSVTTGLSTTLLVAPNDPGSQTPTTSAAGGSFTGLANKTSAQASTRAAASTLERGTTTTNTTPRPSGFSKTVTPASTRPASPTPKRSATVTTTATRVSGTPKIAEGSTAGVVKKVATQATNPVPKTITTAQPSTVTRRVAAGSSIGVVKKAAAAGSAQTTSKTGDTTTDTATRSSRLPKAVPSPSKASTRVLIAGQGAMTTPKVGSTPGKATTQRAPVRTPLVGRSTPSVKATTSIAGGPSTGVARKAASVSVRGSFSTNRRTGIPTRKP